MITLIKNILFCVFAFFLIISLTRSILDYQKKVQFYNTYQNDLQTQKNENNKLKSEMARSKDNATREENIRNKLNLLKSNEIAIILPVSPTPEPSPMVVEKTYAKWISLFLHK